MSIIICLAIITIYSVVRLVLYWIHKDKAIEDFNDGRCFVVMFSNFLMSISNTMFISNVASVAKK